MEKRFSKRQKKRNFFSYNFSLKNRRGAILMENVIFIILNVFFLIILILFLLKQGQGTVLLEQSYAKQISLLIDSAKPGMTIVLNMEKAKKLVDKNNVYFNETVSIRDNAVLVRLSEKGGYTYSFFNDVNVSVYPDKSNPENIKSYVIKINEYN